ncbi:MAG: hypothetical protein L6R42_003287 [Xanthoria sp. 1 TBL-2021]|nr:MAG: hypothetical protein L6R42_003287 [Xanthoria sp. 1 TBL-2021]
MSDQHDNLNQHLSKLEHIVNEFQEIFAHADEWELDNFEKSACSVHESGTATGYRGRRVAGRVDAIIRDMENVNRGDADGVDVLRDFLLRQRRASCEEDIKGLQDERDAIIEEQKKRKSAEEGKGLQSFNTNDKLGEDSKNQELL